MELLQYLNNNIYQSFLKKVGSDWVEPYNKNKFMTCGEFTICADLHEIGLMIKKKKMVFLNSRQNELKHNESNNRI